MITLDFDKALDKVKVNQTVTEPIIYLDNWAINLFIQDLDLRTELIELLRKKQATWALSLINIIEIVNRIDSSQVKEIKNLIDSVNTVTIITIPAEAINVEKEGRPFPFDDGLIKTIASIYDPDKGIYTPGEIQISKSIQLFIDDPSLKDQLPSGGLTELINPSIKKAREDEVKFQEIKTHYRNRLDPLPIPCTDYLYRRAFEFVVLDGKEMKESEWNDFCHTVVPLSYCDFVLIDKRWRTFVEQAQTGWPHIANAYKESELSQFFTDLESFKYNRRHEYF